MQTAADRVAREDLVLFINACFACTGQAEFYGGAAGQSVSIRFVHEYILGNYRRLYARTLAAGINHFNQGLIVKNLLRSGAPPDPMLRAEEGQLILATLLALPPQRTYHLFRELRRERVNNRRTRAVIREFLARRPDPAFDAVKYRAHVRAAAAHAHLKLSDERGAFLFSSRKRRGAYTTPLFESFRRAHYSGEAIYELPYSIALGFTRKYAIPPGEFLTRIAPRMTAAERTRLLGAAARAEAAPLAVDLGRVPLTKLCLYLLSLTLEERKARKEELAASLRAAAERAVRRAPLSLGRVAAVLDNSYSSSGSEEKRRRPLAVALATSALLRAVSKHFLPCWTQPPPDGEELLLSARGQTALAEPLLRALEFSPDLVVIISDGFENDPHGAATDIVQLYRTHIDRARRVSIVHLNPVFCIPLSKNAVIPSPCDGEPRPRAAAHRAPEEHLHRAHG